MHQTFPHWVTAVTRQWEWRSDESLQHFAASHFVTLLDKSQDLVQPSTNDSWGVRENITGRICTSLM